MNLSTYYRFLVHLGHSAKKPMESQFVTCHHHCHSESLSAYVSSPHGHMVNDRDIVFGKYMYLYVLWKHIKY